MKTISLQKYAPVITMKNIKVVNQDIHEGMQSNQPFAIDFKGIEGIEMAAASELLNPLREKYGTRYRQEVQFQNVEPLVGNAFVFSGSTAHSTTTANSRRRSFFSRMFFSLLFLLTLGVGEMWAEYYIRHPFGGNSWETKQMTYESGSTFTYVGYWGNEGANHGGVANYNNTGSPQNWWGEISGKQNSWTTSTLVKFQWNGSTLSASAFTDVFPTGAILYLKTSSDWQSENAYFAAYFFNGSSSATWKKMTRVGETDYYYVAAPAGYSSVIFGRMNPANETPAWGDGHVWNSTIDLAYHSDKNAIEVSNWNPNDYWSVYQPTSTGSVTASSSSVSPSTAVTLTPSITSNTTYNVYKSVAYSVNTGSSGVNWTIVGNTFTPLTTGDYTITATITYNAIGFPSITSTVAPTVDVSCVNTPTLTMSSVSPTTLVSGETVTINVSRANSSATISYEYTDDAGSHWYSLTPASTSNEGQTATWVIPANTGATKTYNFRAKMTDGSLKTTDASDDVTAYGKKVIHVRDNNNWGTSNIKIHYWGSTITDTEWPGTKTGISSMGGQWFNVVVLSCYDGFQLNNGSGTYAQDQTGTLLYTGSGCVTDNAYYTMSTNDYSNQTLSTSTEPTAPTSVTTSDEDPTGITDSQMTIHGSIGTNGNDNITDYGFYYGTTNACGTKAQVGTSNTTGSISNQLTGLTAGTTYYFKTYATNGQGTSYGDVQSYKVPYKVTISTNTGCTSISPSGTQYTNSTISVTATKTTGYTFSSWSITNGTETSTSSTSTTNTIVFTPSANNATIQPTYTENEYSTNVAVSPAGYGSISSPTPAAGKIDVKQVTGTNVTASVASSNYIFESWSATGGGISPTSSTTNPQSFTATSAGGTITANFADVWNLKGNQWSSWGTYKPMTATANANEFSTSLTLTKGTTYLFKVVKRNNNSGASDTWYGNQNTSGNKVLGRGDGAFSTYTGGGNDDNISITPDVNGTYTFTINTSGSTPSITVTFQAAYTVEFGSDDHGTVTASATSAGGSFTSGDYVASGDVVTFAQTPATGYTFKGWYTTPSGSTSAGLDGSNQLTINAAKTVYAQYTANTYAVTFDYDDNGGSKTSGADANNATFDQNTITTPVVCKDGYCLDGWYSAASDGVKVIDKDGNLQPNVSVSATTWTDANGKWKKDGTATVYAVYTVPTIEMSASPAVLNVKKPEKDTVVIHQTFSCTPTGTYNVVYTVGYSANHTQLAPQPTIIYGTAGYDSIVMPMASANTYEIVAELRTGSIPGSGTLLKRDTINYAVEDEYSVTLHYMVDGVQIRSSRTVSAYSSATETPTEVRVAVEESGYELDHWEMGVGIDSINGRGSIIDGGSAGSLQSKYIYASNNGNIYLHYKPKTNTVYFFNTFDKYWNSTIMKKYDYGTTDDYWNSTYGADSHGGLTNDTVKSTTTSLEEKKWMASIGGSTTHFAFTNKKMDNYDHFYGNAAGNEWARVIYRTDYNSATPMFVPVSKNVDEDYYVMNHDANGEAHYYRGFWVKYSPSMDSTGYYLKVYNGTEYGSSLVESIPLRLTQTGEGNTWELTASMDLEANKTYGFKFTKATGTSSVDWYTNASTMTAADHEGWVFTSGAGNNCGLTTTSAGDYTFHVFCKDFGTKDANTASASDVQGQLAVTVDYATVSGDYRVIYSDATQTEWIASPSIHPVANGQDTVSFFIRKSDASRVMKIQKFDTNWDDLKAVDLSSIAKDSVYVIYLQQNEGADDIEVAGYDFYDGDYYIRTDCVDEHKWDYKQSLDNHRMNASDYGMSETQPVQFTHYYVHWIDANQNVKFVVANKYAPCVSDTLITDAYANVAGGNLPNAGASVRFMYNKGTNDVARAYLAGAQGGAYTPNYLKLRTSTDSLSNATGKPAPIDSITFTDLKNFVYQAEIKAKPGLTATLTAQYNGNTQYFKGSELEEEEILGGTTTAWQSLLLTYDFKVNRLICAWQPSGDSIEGNTPINADVMIIRTGQEDAQQIIFKNNDSKLSSVKYIYGVMQFNYDDMVGHMYTWGSTAYGLCMYYISFPYDVLVNDIMAPGRMGTEWRIQRYNGAKRAKGWFAGDGVTTFWEDVQSGDTLHAYEGYSLLLNRRLFNDGSSSVWANKGAGSKLYMYFPSKDATTGVVANKSVDVTVPSHECTLDRVFDQDMDKPEAEQRNHKIVDSHWNMIGTPLFEDHTAATIATGPTVEGEELKYVYAWNPAGNTLGIASTLSTSWKFKTMYSYMAQYAGTITFTGSAVGDVVAAPRRTPKENYTLNLELTKDEMFIGRTYVELRENAVDSFLLNEDVYMVKNGVTADLYTFAGAYEAGANVMSVGSHTIPVGIDVKTAGTYTFSMPDNFDGTVTLIDTYAQTRTNLNIEDYEVTLNKGTINDRFLLEIDIANAPTAIDGASDGQGTLKDGKAHKFIMNDQMYILKDGVIYDARGSRVK